MTLSFDIAGMFGFWDVALIAAAAGLSTLVAHLHSPKWKSIVMTLPIPYTISVMAVGRPVDATNVLGLMLLLVFINATRLFYCKLNVPIVVAIGLSSLLIGAAGTVANQLVPTTNGFFWLSCALALLLAAGVFTLMPRRDEKGHRGELPLRYKIPVILAVVTCLILGKKYLSGFMTVFPVVAMVTAYEGRKCLWTICRQIPVIIFCLLPMMMVSRLCQRELGVGVSLVLAWVAFLIVFIGSTKMMWRDNASIERPGIVRPGGEEPESVLS